MIYKMKTNFYIYNWLRTNTAKLKNLFTYYVLDIYISVLTGVRLFFLHAAAISENFMLSCRCHHYYQRLFISLLVFLYVTLFSRLPFLENLFICHYYLVMCPFHEDFCIQFCIRLYFLSAFCSTCNLFVVFVPALVFVRPFISFYSRLTSGM